MQLRGDGKVCGGDFACFGIKSGVANLSVMDVEKCSGRSTSLCGMEDKSLHFFSMVLRVYEVNSKR